MTATNISENNNNAVTSVVKSREVSRECEKEPPLDYTDLEGKLKLDESTVTEHGPG
jgi:hypothetical protein